MNRDTGENVDQRTDQRADGPDGTGSAAMGETLVVPDPADPDAALAAVVALRRVAERLEFAAVQHAVEQGWTWTQIADALGVTRQAAHKRHARRAPRRTGDER